MTEDKNVENSYGFLDSIVIYLATNATSYYASISDIHLHLFGNNIEQNEEDYIKNIFRTLSDKNFLDSNDYNISDNTQAQYIKLIEAINFLNNEDYVKIYSKTHIRLTFKGILKYSNSFTQIHHKKKFDSERLLFVEETQLNQNQGLLEANQKMVDVNVNISRLTFWIMLASVVAAVYYLLLILKLLFPKIICL